VAQIDVDFLPIGAAKVMRRCHRYKTELSNVWTNIYATAKSTACSENRTYDREQAAEGHSISELWIEATGMVQAIRRYHCMLSISASGCCDKDQVHCISKAA